MNSGRDSLGGHGPTSHGPGTDVGAYPLPTALDRRIVVARVASGQRVRAFLLLGDVAARSWSAHEVGADTSGLEFFGVPHGPRQTLIGALRPGLGADDDEIVAQLLTEGTGSSLWVTPAVPTPRGVLAIGVIRMIEESLTAPEEDSGTVEATGDDGAWLRRDLGLSAEHAHVSRLVWAHDQDTSGSARLLILEQGHAAGDDDASHAGLLVGDGGDVRPIVLVAGEARERPSARLALPDSDSLPRQILRVLDPNVPQDPGT